MARSFLVLMLLGMTTIAVQAQDKPAPDKPAPDKPAPDEPVKDEPVKDEPANSSDELELESVNQRGSYAWGFQIGRHLKSQGSVPLITHFVAGLKAAMDGKSRIEAPDLQAALDEFKTEGARNTKKLSEQYLVENKKKKGVITLESGLQYEVLKTGKGATPTASDQVTTHYHGTLIDGTVFDSSVDRGEPTTFPVNGVIAGWTEALKLMKVGDKWRLTVPAHLAYGVRGTPGGPIGPNCTLIFDVELLKIVE
jgi:FKBP-type peptidyl-prolyl cis-trans isomerase FklB